VRSGLADHYGPIAISTNTSHYKSKEFGPIGRTEIFKKNCMNQKVSEAIKKDEIDLDDINSWASILQTTEKEVAKTKLARWTPRNLYELEKVNKGAFHEVLEGLTPIIQVGVSKLLQYLEHEEQKKRDEEKVKAQRELNAELEKGAGR
jgi:hypothetical protein